MSYKKKNRTFIEQSLVHFAHFIQPDPPQPKNPFFSFYLTKKSYLFFFMRYKWNEGINLSNLTKGRDQIN